MRIFSPACMKLITFSSTSSSMACSMSVSAVISVASSCLLFKSPALTNRRVSPPSLPSFGTSPCTITRLASSLLFASAISVASHVISARRKPTHAYEMANMACDAICERKKSSLSSSWLVKNRYTPTMARLLMAADDSCDWWARREEGG